MGLSTSRRFSQRSQETQKDHALRCSVSPTDHTMAQPGEDLPPVNAILSGPHWPGRVRVVRAERKGTGRVLIEAVTLDDQSRLISRLLKREDLAGLAVEAENDRPTLAGDPAGFRLTAEATRIRLAANTFFQLHGAEF